MSLSKSDIVLCDRTSDVDYDMPLDKVLYAKKSTNTVGSSESRPAENNRTTHEPSRSTANDVKHTNIRRNEPEQAVGIHNTASTMGSEPSNPYPSVVTDASLSTVPLPNVRVHQCAKGHLNDANIMESKCTSPVRVSSPTSLTSSTLGKGSARVTRVGRRCCTNCMRRLRPPPWFRRLLLRMYKYTGGMFTYALLLVAIYTTCFSVRPSVTKPPVCRRVAVPIPQFSLDNNQTTTVTPLSVTEQSLVSDGYTEALECRRGEALSVLIFYGCAFVFGEIMEMLHLPGLLGMLLGGLALRNIGITLIPQTVYHEGTLPNGSYTLESLPTDSLFEGKLDDSAFTVRDPLTQLAALLIVNPGLSGILRQLALTTILSRAGLGLDPSTLKQVCGSVFRLAFIPCLCEALCLMIVTRYLIGWPWVWGAILGFVCAAVSPAVIVPNIMRLEVTGWGVAEGIPTLVVAAASLDDVIAITGFGVALAVGLSTGESLVFTLFWGPVEALTGAAFGVAVGVLICLFPPPKLEHSHVLRGILLLLLAVTGLLGSTILHLPGAGALACLTLAFFVATGWRAGFPWRLTQADESMLDQTPVDEQHTDNEEFVNKPHLSTHPKSLTGTTDVAYNQVPLNSNTLVTQPGTTAEDNIVRTSVPGHEKKMSLSDTHVRTICQAQKDSGASSILETLVENHPHYCSILRQQYRTSLIKESTRHSSLRGRSLSKRLSKGVTGGDLPSIAVAVAATGADRRTSSTVALPTGTTTTTSFRTRPRGSRRFSLPEPTAHYEQESFTAPSSIRRSVSPAVGGSNYRTGSQQRRRGLSPTFREQYEAMFSQPIDSRLEEIEENDIDSRTSKSDDVTEIDSADEHFTKTHASGGGSESGEISRQATPQERGLACVNAMRQTLAVVWWFVQPILFSLIGSEVNLYHITGESTGLGVVALLIALLFRVAATIIAVLPSKMNMKERLFVSFSWLPKATVQAAVGPLALDTARKLNAPYEIIGYAQQVLTLAALVILMTAPLGALLMPLTAPYLLRQDLNAAQVMVSKTKRLPCMKTQTKTDSPQRVERERSTKPSESSPH